MKPQIRILYTALTLILTITHAIAALNLDQFLSNGQFPIEGPGNVLLPEGSGKVYIPPAPPAPVPQPPETVPKMPTPLFISSKTTTTFLLHWKDRSSVEDGYGVYRDGVFIDEANPPDSSSKIFSYTDKDLSPDTNYCYQVEAYNTYGSSFSPEVCASTNQFTPQGAVMVEDREGFLGELEDTWEGEKVVYVADDAEIDLSLIRNIHLKSGLTLMSGRGKLNKGALLFTSVRDTKVFFQVAGDNVRITGLRIQGPEPGFGEGNSNIAEGIYVESKINIEIDHNELYGWSGAAIDVRDHDAKISDNVRRHGRINAANADTVYIHDNYIHHNQHEGTRGYGVVLYNGAYALIERNVFDYNRHAVAADGREGTGYLAYENLILKNGGLHRRFAGVSWYTHQFDMHGRDNCGIGDLFSDALYNCGDAGEYMDIRHNTFQYTEDNAFKLRGTPKHWDSPGIDAGVDLISNVFAHKVLFAAVSQRGTYIPPNIEDLQMETGLYLGDMYIEDNLFGVDTSNELGTGDFDGDGINDEFQATGATWWYSSGGETEWRYLNTSKKMLKDLVFWDVDRNGKTDVLTRSGNGWLISYDGIGRWEKLEE